MGSKRLLTQDQKDSIQLLRSIVERKIGRPITTRYRKREIVQAKMIFSLILSQNGVYGKEIARQIGYDHSSVIHHIKTIKILIDQDSNIRSFYLSVKEEFDNEKIGVTLFEDYKSLPIGAINYIDGLIMENNQLKLEAKELRQINSDRLGSIYRLIHDNTPAGAEYIVERKIKKALNV